MSRTYAHVPYNVRRLTAKRPALEDHDHRNGECRLESIQDYRQRFLPGKYKSGIFRYWATFRCSPELPREGCSKQFTRTMPREFPKLYWEKPARAQTRITLRTSMREYNSYGETNIEPEPHRHRHQALFWW